MAAVLIAASLSAARPAQAAVPQTITKDKVSSLPGVFRGGSRYTADAGGRSSSPGDYGVDFGAAGSGPVYVQDATFMNAGGAKNELTVAFWAKKYDIAAGSAFWANSPGSNNGQRGYQAHVPWDNGQIYFDHAGCCDAPQRISAGIDTFPGYSGDVTWWNGWHHFAFSIKAGVKQIWVDGQLFLEGVDAAAVPTDFTDLYIGSDGAGGGLYHAVVDDFAVFSTQLPAASMESLFQGTAPSALPATAGLIAYWDFNDVPSDGQFLSVSPTPDTTSAAPNLVQVVHIDGSVAWAQNNVSLTLDGAPAVVTVTRVGNVATVTHVPSTLLAVQSSHTAVLTYPSGAGQQTLEWSFSVAPYTKDTVASRIGAFARGSGYTPDRGGRTGQAGDFAADFGSGGTGPIEVGDGSFLNTASANDEMSFALWADKADIAAGSVFWAVSPSSNNGQRGWQAHLPWDNNQIYFDTSGCCDGTQRINAGIDTFPGYSGELTWWNDWHFFVFSKKAGVKQIWIDGVLFLEGADAAALPTDFTRLMIGSDNGGVGNLYHGLVDDFSVFSKQLSEADIQSLFTGTSPSALPADRGLLAYWNFNDIPAAGIFLSFSPADGTLDAAPNRIQVVHLQGSSAWDLSKVSLKVDGLPVSVTPVRDAGKVTITYVPSPIFAAKSVHTASLTYPDGAGLATKEWQFTVGSYTKDVVGQVVGLMTGAAAYTPSGGGRSAQPGDHAMDFGRTQNGQSVSITDLGFLNTAAAADELSIGGWQKLYSVRDSAFVWGVSPSSNGSRRGWGTHTPWSNNNLYFDTAGCCDGVTQRVSAGIDTLPAYSGDATWWNDWHHFVFQKKGSLKEIWIDGVLFLQGDSTNPLPTDFIQLLIGYNPADNGRLQGILDDVAVFGTALTEANIGQWIGGTLPTALPASTKLVAYWNFNDAPADVPVISITRAAGGAITVTFTGRLQSSTRAAGGPASWADVPNATSGMQIQAGDPQRYYRSVR